jgi:hypothetical protein
VTWIVRRAVKLGLVVSVAVGIAAFTSSGLRAILLDGYVLAMGGIFLLALVRTTRAKAPADVASELDNALAEMRSGRRDSGQPLLVREVELSLLSALHLHVRLRPLLREIAAHRLLKHYGVDLDREPARARELIGASAWELVRPDRPVPADRLSPGPPLSELRDVVAELERV